MNQLHFKLKGSFSSTEIEDIMADYAGFFDAGTAEGKSEETLCEEFGSPEKVALELRNGNEKAKNRYLQKMYLKSAFLTALTIIFAYSTLYLYKNGLSAPLVYAFFLPVLAQFILSNGLAVRQASPEKDTARYRWMNKVQIVCFVFLILGTGTLFALMANMNDTLSQSSEQFTAQTFSFLLKTSLFLLMFSTILHFIYALRVNPQVRWYLFFNTALFTMLLNIKALLTHINFPLSELLGKALLCSLNAFVPSLLATLLFLIVAQYQKKRRMSNEWSAEKGRS